MNTPGRKKGSSGAPEVPGTRRERRLHDATLDWLRGRFGADGAALPFARAVTLQLARPPGRAASAAAELEAARRVAEPLEAPAAPGAPARLAADPELLAAFFQNVDLLFAHGFPGADQVALLVMTALEFLD